MLSGEGNVRERWKTGRIKVGRWNERSALHLIGTLRYSGRGQGGRQPEVNVQFLELISIMPQRRPEVATVKTRSLAAS